MIAGALERFRLWRRFRRPLSLADLAAWTMGAGILLLVAAALGVASQVYGAVAIAAAFVILLVGIASTNIALIPLLAFPAVLIPIRTGPLSVTDLVLIAATVPAFLLYRREEAGNMQPLIWLGIGYQAALIPTLLLNPNTSNLVEWGHELFMVIGGLLVGFVVGRRGLASAALRFYVLACAAIGVWAFVVGLIMLAKQGDFGPVFLPYMHKNFIGDTLVFGFIIAFMRPDWLGWGRRFCYAMMAMTAMGIAASGARQAMVSLAVAILLLSLRGREGGGGRGRILIIAIIPAMWFVLASLSAQLDKFAAGDRFNSAAERLVWFGKSLEIWRDSPLFGVGLRWWYTDRYDTRFQPPNAIFEMLSSAGLVGTIAFLVLCLGGLWVLATLNPRYGNLAVAILVARFTQGQLDLYWLAGLSSMPWMIAGLVIGVEALHTHGPHTRKSASGERITATLPTTGGDG